MEADARTFLGNYAKFVNEVTSDESKSTEELIKRINVLQDQGCNVSRLLTASEGLGAEAGEFTEIVKKMMFQGKEYNEGNIFHMKRELGDVIWYWMQACMALGHDPVDVILENINKLRSRYPSGEFDVWKSENRKDGDL